MIQTILLFALGFLCAAFLALLAAPVLWRRAVSLTRRRVEATAPLSKDEIDADKDRLRADFAMSARRLEMNLKILRDKAAAQRVEIDRLRHEVKELKAERDAQEGRLAAFETRTQERETALGQRQKETEALSARIAELEGQDAEARRALQEMSGMYEEASYASSSRQIELVAREGEIDRLSEEVSGLRKQRKEAERAMREAEAERKSAQEALRAENERAQGLESRLERQMTALSDRDEKLDRREKEIERLRQETEQKVQQAEALAGRLQVEKTTLEVEVERLNMRLAAIMAEPVGGNGTEAGNALLREQIGELAAEVVRLTAMLETPDSPLRQALADGAQNNRAPNGAPMRSIADRVRALQEAAAAN